MIKLEENHPSMDMVARSYQKKVVKHVCLKDGTQLTLRMIQPEDESLWLDLLERCSQNSIYMRFQYAFHWHSHQVANRYCTIDYNQEIAIVPELKEDGKTKLLGVARLIADPDHRTVEFAILIADAWQHRGLGSILADYCFEIVKGWGCKKIVAQTTKDNPQMISIFRKRGFKITTDPHTSTVYAIKVLSENEI